eukprot:COSAG03_NODE_20762_length_314_cov_0.720930_1_plen_83_part_01
MRCGLTGGVELRNRLILGTQPRVKGCHGVRADVKIKRVGAMKPATHFTTDLFRQTEGVWSTGLGWCRQTVRTSRTHRQCSIGW